MNRNTRLGRLFDRVRHNRRDMARVALQTAVAATVTYWAVGRLGMDQHLSWAVIASLFTISVSADGALVQGFGRVAGAFLGVALGLGAAIAFGGPVVIGLALASAAANTVATIWPNLRYAAVTAAIVALEPTPELAGTFERAAAILVGTAIGVAATLVVWPRFGRQRITRMLRDGLGDCEILLRLIEKGVETDERDERDAVHARFLGRLEAIHADLNDTYFAPRLKSGIGLRRAAVALEDLWHTIVILDRAISDERTAIGPEEIARLRPPICRTQEEARGVVAGLRRAITHPKEGPPRTQAFREAVAAARAEAERFDLPRQQSKALLAVVFALDELERHLLRILVVLVPEETGPPARGREGGPSAAAA